MNLEKLRKILITAIAMLLLVSALIVSSGETNAWHFQQVATGRYFPSEIIYNAAGKPGFIQMDYYSEPYRIIYRYLSNFGWTSEIIGNASQQPEVALNHLGQPSALFVRYEGDADALIYATRTADNTWQETVVESLAQGQGYIDSQYSLTYDAYGKPCITYIKTTSSPYTCSLYYAVYNGNTWQKQIVYTGNDTFYSDLKFSGSTPTIAFSAGKQGLKYAYLNNGKWTIQTVDASSATRLRNRQGEITLSHGNGIPLISYNDIADRTLKFAYCLDGVWTTKTVEASVSEKNHTGDYAKMQVVQEPSRFTVYLMHSNFTVNGNTSIKLKTLSVNSNEDLAATAFNSETLYSADFGNMTPIIGSGIKDGNPSMVFFDYWRGKTTLISKQPKLSAPNSIVFNPTAPGESESRDIAIVNNGALDLVISEVIAPDAPFRITGDGTGSLAPGQSKVITVHYEPSVAGAASEAAIIIRSNDPYNPDYALSIKGRAIGNNANLSELSLSNGTHMTLLSTEAAGSTTVSFATESLKITPTTEDAYTRIVINAGVYEAEVQSGMSSDALPMQIGSNSVTIKTTSEDGLTEKTYTLNITRLDSPDASLSNLTVSHGILTPEFSPEIHAYTMTLPDGVSSFTFTPTATPMGALAESTISINGVGTANNSESAVQAAVVGSNTYTFHVVAPDSATTKNYTVTVLRKPELDGISLDHGELDKVFNPYDLTYTVVVPNSVMALNITPIADESYAVAVNGDSASGQVLLETGENATTLVVSSSDGMTSRVYTLNVKRLPGLAALSVGETPVMFFGNAFDLSVNITNNLDEIVFSLPEGMSGEILGLNTSSDGFSEPIVFSEGLNGPYVIQLTSPECTEKAVYKLSVYRIPTLTSLELHGDEIDLWSDEFNYIQTVPNTSTSAMIKATVNEGTDVVPDGNYVYTPIDGETNAWTVDNLRMGSNPIYLRLTASDNQTESIYTINIIHPPVLSSLTVSEGTLTPSFEADVYEYSVNVDEVVEEIALSISVPLNEVTGYPTSRIYVNEVEIASGGYTDPIALNLGTNNILITTHTDDYVNTLYTLNIIRGESEAPIISPNPPPYEDTGTSDGSAGPLVTNDSRSTHETSLPPEFVTGSLSTPFTIASDLGNVSLPANMLSGVSISGDATLMIRATDRSKIPEHLSTAIGNRPLISITLNVDGEQVNWSNPNAPVRVSIPYEPTADELQNPESIVIWYIDHSGNAITIPNGHYDELTQTVSFTITHFSDFAVAYNAVNFNDVASDAWYRKAVGFISAREIANGIDEGVFKPEGRLTRGEFIVMLLRAFGISPDLGSGENFSDAGNTYYTDYLKSAKTLGISTGVGNNLCAPTREITRQEMFVLLHNALKLMGKRPQGKTVKSLLDFPDSGTVDIWAKEAISLLVENGIVNGKNGALKPQDSTTRAEMAQVLYNIIKR